MLFKHAGAFIFIIHLKLVWMRSIFSQTHIVCKNSKIHITGFTSKQIQTKWMLLQWALNLGPQTSRILKCFLNIGEFCVFYDSQQSWFLIGFEEVEIFVYSLKWKVFVLQKRVSTCTATFLYFKSVYSPVYSLVIEYTKYPRIYSVNMHTSPLGIRVCIPLRVYGLPGNTYSNPLGESIRIFTLKALDICSLFYRITRIFWGINR